MQKLVAYDWQKIELGRFHLVVRKSLYRFGHCIKHVCKIAIADIQ